MTDFFQKNYSRFNIDAEGLRNCQRGAYYATLAHFSRSSSPCLIGLPTGAGKTALMMAINFGLRSKRVLIVTPAAILRYQTAMKFETLDDLVNINAFLKGKLSPKVFEAKHEFRSEADWNKCAPYDVVVATPNVTSSAYAKIIPTPKGLFDLLIIDEAHHVEAPTWKTLLEYFSQAGVRSILMTGTPYRRDRRELSAELIYDYPISMAIEDKIFAPVKFVGAGKSKANKDVKLARKAVAIREQIQKEHNKTPLLLIKTDQIKHADLLTKLYDTLGLKVPAIHTGIKEEDNQTTLDMLRAGKVDGIVAVGMVGEGLDVRDLKLAVFHRNPQSLPHTLQVIGRLSRTGAAVSQGYVIGYQDDFSKETFSLYDASPDWLKLIPALERKLISGRIGQSSKDFLEGEENFLFDMDITPNFSISVFESDDKVLPANLDELKNFRRHRNNQTIIVEKVAVFEDDTIVVVTKSVRQPDWVRHTGYSRIIQETYDLHIFFQYRKLILEYSTSPQIATNIISALFPYKLRFASPNKLNHVLEAGDGAYIIVGLKNSAAFFQGQPSYKMLLGKEVQASILHRDNQIFHAGHVLMKLDRDLRNSEVRGVAYKKGRIWSLGRGNLRAFREWCIFLAKAMLEEGNARLPGLESLRITERLSKFSPPLAIVHNTALLTCKVDIVPEDDNEAENLDFLPDISIEGNTQTSILFKLQGLDTKFEISLSDKSELHLSQTNHKNYQISVDNQGVINKYSFIDFLEEYFPCILFSDGSTLVDGFYSKPATVSVLPSTVLSAENWAGCDIHSEIDDTKIGRSVQSFLENKIITKRDKDLILIHDHAKGEIADAITINLIRKHICFYHVKSARVENGKRLAAGGARKDLENAIAEAVCSGKWIKNIDFAQELNRHVEERGGTSILQGSKRQMQEFLGNYAPNLFTFEVIIVQPALKITKISKNLNHMIAVTFDYLRGLDAKLAIYCSP